MQPFIVKSTQYGRGLFAARPIRRGEVVTIARGPIIPYSVVARKRKPDNALQISRNRYIDFRAPGVYANHSCTPNAGFSDDTILIAIKDIEKGQEITYDYSTTMDKDTEASFESGRCLCGSRACRGTITGFKTLPKSLQSFYKRLDVVQKFLLKEK